MRIRQPSNFSWWADCNMNAFYGTFGSQGNILVYFGQSRLHFSLLRKLEPFSSYATVLQQTTKTLRQAGNFGIAVFDNSQVFTKLKFQRDATSSMVTKTTSRLFLRPTVPSYMVDIPEVLQHQHSDISYINQAIPSPYGMPSYEASTTLDAAVFKLDRHLAFRAKRQFIW